MYRSSIVESITMVVLICLIIEEGSWDEATRVVVLLSAHLGFQGEFPVGVVEGKGLLLFQHLSQGSVDPQWLQVVGYLTTRPGSGKRGGSLDKMLG